MKSLGKTDTFVVVKDKCEVQMGNHHCPTTNPRTTFDLVPTQSLLLSGTLYLSPHEQSEKTTVPCT